MKQQLREQAIASSKVQSHLVETLGNMETVKVRAWSFLAGGDGNNFMGNK